MVTKVLEINRDNLYLKNLTLKEQHDLIEKLSKMTRPDEFPMAS